MAAGYLKEIRNLQPQGPYYLGGYCMGGGLAYEMAQQLHAQGQPVALLAMFETYNIQSNPRSLSFLYRAYHPLQNIKFHGENLLRLKPRDKLTFFMKKAQVEKSRIKAGFEMGVAKIAHKLKLNNGLPYTHQFLKKLNDRAFREYKPQAFPGRITLFRPQKFFLGADDPQFGWKELAVGGLDVYKIAAYPRGMLVEPYVRELAERLKTCIQDTMKPAQANEDPVHASSREFLESRTAQMAE
jgi:phthiocerol/phenolphthiocerol synthesis type-I polyketide synthase E